MDCKRLLIAWALGEVSEDLLPGIAREMVETGFDSPSLQALAESDLLEQAELSALFVATLSELGFEPVTIGDALLERAKDIAEGIAEGSINPFEGAYWIWLIRRDQGGPDVLEPFGKIVEKDLAEVDALLHNGSSIAVDLLRARRSEIDHRYEGLILDEARHLVSAGTACLGPDADFD